jgi:hypothetical protein
MHFPFHLLIRWFGSTFNILMAMFLAINMAILEGEI